MESPGSILLDKYDVLLERVRHGALSGEEIAEVIGELQKPLPETDRYTLLYLLGRAGDPTQSYLVEPYLNGPDDMLARLALWVLCWYWGLTSLYIENLVRFMHGVHWDAQEQCRLAATSIAGDYLKSKPSPPLLWELITIFENKGEDQNLRTYAYSALAEAVGREPSPLPVYDESFNLDAAIDPTVLEEAQARLAREEGWTT